MTGETSISELAHQAGEQGTKELPCLLIIDDSPDVVQFMIDLFEDEYTCVTADDGNDGIIKAEQLLPDIILCDVRMPNKSGMEVVRELKSHPQTRLIPIILLSGFNTRENRLEGLRAMADDFIAKPFDFEELRIKMNNLLHLRSELKTTEHENIIQKHLGLDISEYSRDQRAFIESCLLFIEQHYIEKELDVAQMADKLGLSIRQLQRKVKDITKFSPMDLVKIYRLRKSAKLLQRHSSIAEVAESCGFGSPNYFCTCFKDYFTQTPSQYQKKRSS